MLRLGALPAEAREMDIDDIFLARLRLLIIMSKAYLIGCPLGEHRRWAMLENARHVEAESIDLGGLISGFSHQYPNSGPDDFDHVFYQRVKLLAVMLKAVAKGFPMGDHRKAAMQENLDIICEPLGFEGRNEEMAFLRKVA